MKARWQLLDNLVEAVEEVDPDWMDNFLTLEQAAEFYAAEPEFIAIVEEILEEESDEDE
jgi:hypothetical protein